MKKLLLALGLLAACAGTAWAQTAGTNTVSRNGYFFNATTGERTNADGSAYTVDQNPEYLMDFGVTNLIASAAVDTGGALGANVKYSAAVDVRQYGKGKINIIVHVTPAAADTAVGSAYWYDLAVAVFPLPSAVLDWGGTNITTVQQGVPYVPIKSSPLLMTQTDLTAATAADSVGSFGVILTPNAANLGPGERRIRFSATRPANINFNNVSVFQTVMLPATYWLGDVQPRYLAVQVRHIQKATGATGAPFIRVDMEGLR